jgi:hypothetical protein
LEPGEKPIGVGGITNELLSIVHYFEFIMTKRIDEIELHSKEVQDLLGKVPSWLIRNGNLMVFVILLLLVAGTWFFKYPDIISAPVVVTTKATDKGLVTGSVQVKMSGKGKIKTGQRVILKFTNYPYLEYGTVRGIVGKIAELPSGDSYALEVDLPEKMNSSFGKNLDFQDELKGIAEIVTEEISLMERMLKPMRKLFGLK